MDIELLLVPDCPSGPPAAALLRDALDQSGLTNVEFTTTVVSTQGEAEARGFTGSPSVFIDGKDAFPIRDSAPAVACRLYRSGGRMSGIPDRDELVFLLQRATSR